MLPIKLVVKEKKVSSNRYVFTLPELYEIGKNINESVDRITMRGNRSKDIEEAINTQVNKIYREQSFPETTTKWAFNPTKYERKVTVKIDNEKEKWIQKAKELEAQLKRDVSCSINKELVYSKAMGEFYKKNKLTARQKFGDIVVPHSSNN